MKIGMLTFEQYDNRRPGSVGSSRIRGEWMMKYCPAIEKYENGRHFDVMIYQKAYYKEHMALFSGIKIFDLCDPDWFEFRPVRETLELVDAVTVPTQALADYLKSMKPELVVKVIPDRIDPEAHPVKKNIHIGPLRSVVWFGYSENAGALDLVLEPLKERGITLVVISDRPYLEADVNIKYEQTTVLEELIKHDAVILPTFEGNYRTLFKSDNKVLTSWAIGMPVIKEFDDLELYESPERRKFESDTRYNQVRLEYHVNKSGPEYLELIRELQANRATRDA